MRKAPIALVGLLLALGGCHHGKIDENRLANTADNLATEMDSWGDAASNRIDATDDSTQNRIDSLDDHMATLVDPPAAEGWIGKWKGAGGLTLAIARDPAKGPNHYLLTDRYKPDDKGIFPGTAKGDAIAFTRPDGPQTLRAADGAATGLRYLAKKKDCLIVKPGEGYCRD